MIDDVLDPARVVVVGLQHELGAPAVGLSQGNAHVWREGLSRGAHSLAKNRERTYNSYFPLTTTLQIPLWVDSPSQGHICLDNLRMHLSLVDWAV